MGLNYSTLKLSYFTNCSEQKQKTLTKIETIYLYCEYGFVFRLSIFACAPVHSRTSVSAPPSPPPHMRANFKCATCMHIDVRMTKAMNTMTASSENCLSLTVDLNWFKYFLIYLECTEQCYQPYDFTRRCTNF